MANFETIHECKPKINSSEVRRYFSKYWSAHVMDINYSQILWIGIAGKFQNSFQMLPQFMENCAKNSMRSEHVAYPIFGASGLVNLGASPANATMLCRKKMPKRQFLIVMIWTFHDNSGRWLKAFLERKKLFLFLTFLNPAQHSLMNDFQQITIICRSFFWFPLILIKDLLCWWISDLCVMCK